MTWRPPTDLERFLLADTNSRWPELIPLARLLVLAPRIEPLLLRNARRRFLPGTEEEKMTPWMGALMDNLEVLTRPEGGDWGRAVTNDLVKSRIRIHSLNFMRGRTFLNKYVILDEAQNLTAKQMKTLITRAGPGTKMVCLGNIGQIDTPYLTETSSGLTYVVDRFKHWPHGGHITLMRGERSRLADFASEEL